jgi:signal transduction histidine kinase/DNA-binding LytR/AlgR family response regulator
MPHLRHQDHLQSSVVLPIALSVGAAILVVIVSLFIGVNQTNSRGIAEQRETLERVLQQRGTAIARELKVQTLWSEGYENSRARNTTWMHESYGKHLERLLGYDRIYVLDGANEVVYGYHDGDAAPLAEFDPVRARISDLIDKVRRDVPTKNVRGGVLRERFDLGGVQHVTHRSAVDVRRIGDRPATVIVLTILPDTPQVETVDRSPFLMVAVNAFDDGFLNDLFQNYGFQNIGWGEVAENGERAVQTVYGLDGSLVGTLSWTKRFPGWEQLREMMLGLVFSFVMLVSLAAFLINRGRKQAKLLADNTRELATLNDGLTQRVSVRTRELEATLENMAQGIVMVGDGGEIVVANNRAIELLELRPDQELRELIKELPKEVSWDGGSASGRLGATLRSDIPRQSGRIVEVRRKATSDGGEVITLSDISVLKRRQAEIEAALQAAKTANEVKSRFLSTMSHEMRTPLNGVIGALELMSDTGLDEKQKGLVDVALQSGEALLVHINDVLDFSKMEAGKLDLVSSPFELRRLLKSVVDIVAKQAKGNGNTVNCEVQPEVGGNFVGDRDRIRQVLLNLVSNANKFTRDGVVSIRVEHVGGNASHPRLRVSVSDTGVGIPAEKLKDLFQEFSMLDSTYARRTGGTGLGLAISKRLIEAMDGKVGVESIEGRGSTFWFEVALPCALDAPGGNAADMPEAVHMDASLKVLLVDDNETNRFVGRRILAAAGHSVETANDGRAAVEAASGELYDVIFMDISMPDMDGMEATKAIRRLPEPFRSVRIIALTANAIAGDREKFLAAGMNDYLTKPLRRADIEARLGGVSTAVPIISGREGATAAVHAGEDDVPLVDRSHLEDFARETSSEVVVAVVEEYLREIQIRAAELRSVVAAAKIDDLEKVSHAIAGSSASAGARRLRTLTKRIELACREGKGEAALVQAALIPSVIDATSVALQSYIVGVRESDSFAGDTAAA